MSRPRVFRARCRGVTLVELVVTISVIAVAGAALMGVLSFIAGSSGESLAQAQGNAIANAYLVEILAKPFNDPAGPDGEAGRANYDDVNDYHGHFDARARDASNALLAGQGTYAVAVSAVPSGALNGVPAASVLRVDVTVTTANGLRVVATGYRTNY
jgi:MSHA pilin protein MshD